MDLHRIRSHPILLSNRVMRIDASKELQDLRPFLQGRVLEVFCRDGLLGSELLQSQVNWFGIDPDATVLEDAFQRGNFSVNCATNPPAGSYQVIFGAFAPLSYLSPEDLEGFSLAVQDALDESGRALFEIWGQEDANGGQAIMDIYDGSQKVVRACVPVRRGNVALFDIEWMIAKPKHTPIFLHHREERYIHTQDDIESAFSWGDIQYVTIDERLWISVKKTNFK